MYFIMALLIGVIIVLVFLIWQFRRQVKDICRQLSFVKNKDSNLRISSQTDSGGLGQLKEILNQMLTDSRKKQSDYDEKERRISETYTNLSHDIRTPLTSLDGYFQLLQECDSEEDKERYITIIRDRIDSLSQMLEELFDYAKLENQSQELELSVINLTRLVKIIVVSYYGDWTARGLKPIIDIPDRGIIITANEGALSRVIRNIVKNILVHGSEEIGISLKEKEGRAVLTASNKTAHPENIDPERVFERFYKGDKARSRSSTGLGLAIAQGLVTQMGGEISATLDGDIFSIIIEFDVVEQ